MKVGWLADRATITGGAELSEREFRAARPESVEIVDCPKGAVIPGLDRYVVHNCVTYELEDLERIGDRPIVKYWNDIGSWLRPECRDWLDRRAFPICCSPLQQDYMQLARCELIPPPIDLQRFMDAAERRNGTRRGNVCVASWRNIGKGASRAAEWSEKHGGVHFYGGGLLRPPDCHEIAYELMPRLLAGYERFVFLPAVLEPFGRLVAEAWAAGCEVITNDLVGARYWIEHAPDRLWSAASDFWTTITADNGGWLEVNLGRRQRHAARPQQPAAHPPHPARAWP